MSVNKVVNNFEEAVADIFDGATVMIGGAQGPVGLPNKLIKALRDKGAKNLSVISLGTGLGTKVAAAVGYPEWYVDYGLLIENKQVKEISCGAPFLMFGGQKTISHDPYYSGE